LPALVSLDSLLVFSTVPSPTLLVQRAWSLMGPLPTVKKRHPTKMKYETYGFY
jgi:hypothetical protein